MRQLYIVATMFFLAVVNIFLLRDSLSLTITQMVKPNANAELVLDDTCPMEGAGLPSAHNGTGLMDVVGKSARRFPARFLMQFGIYF